MQPDLDYLKSKIEGNSDWVDSLVVQVPGYSDYLKKSQFYDIDMAVREFCTDRIRRIKTLLERFATKASRDSKFEINSAIERVQTRAEGLFKKVGHATTKPGGSRGNAEITDDDLQRLLEFDWRLISLLDEIIKPIESAEFGDSLRELMDDLESKLNDFDDHFEKRNTLFLDII